MLAKYRSQQLVFSYALLLVLFYLFDWNPLRFFFTFLIEIIVLVVIYAFLRLKDESVHPERYRKSQPLLNVLIGVTPLILVQSVLIVIAGERLTPKSEGFNDIGWLKNETIWGGSMLAVNYGLLLIFNKKEVNVSMFRDQFLFKCLSITGTTIVAFILLFAFGVNSKWIVLTAVLCIRLYIEWKYFKPQPSV